MRYVLAAAILLNAIPPAGANPLQFQSDTTVGGECRTLKVYDHPPQSQCDAVAELAELKNGRNGIALKSMNGQSYWFFGPRKGEISPNEDTIYLPVDGVRVSGNRAGEDQKAVGFCRYGNPYLGSVDILCHAETMEGPVDARFVTDGKEPSQR